MDESTNEMSSRIKQLEKDVRLLEEAANSAKMLRNKAAYVVRELEMFDEAYLSLEDWPSRDVTVTQQSLRFLRLLTNSLAL